MNNNQNDFGLVLSLHYDLYWVGKKTPNISQVEDLSCCNELLNCQIEQNIEHCMAGIKTE